MKREDSLLWQHAMDTASRVHRTLRDNPCKDGLPDVIAEEALATAIKIPARITLALEEGEDVLERLYESRGLVCRLESALLAAQQVGRLELINETLFEINLLHDEINEEIARNGGETRSAGEFFDDTP